MAIRRPRVRADGEEVPLDLVPPGAEVRLAPAPAPHAPGQAEGRPSNDPSQRDVARRHHGHPPARRDSRLPARGDRQLLSTDLGVAGRVPAHSLMPSPGIADLSAISGKCATVAKPTVRREAFG